MDVVGPCGLGIYGCESCCKIPDRFPVIALHLGSLRGPFVLKKTIGLALGLFTAFGDMKPTVG